MILRGDLFDVLPTLDASSIDACVTDPPYGIGFMGREWDTFKPENVQTAAAMKQRKNSEQLANLQNVYGQKRSPAKSPSQVSYDYTAAGLRGFQDWTAKWAGEVLRVLKPGAYIVVCGAPRSHHRMMCGLEDAGFVVRDCFAWLFGSGFPKNRNLGDGRGTALKPAHEPIALAWKPFKGSISGNVALHGTGALNIDACRIEHAGEELSGGISVSQTGGWARPWMQDDDAKAARRERREASRDVSETLGRWPPNVLLDEEAAALLDEQTGDLGCAGNMHEAKQHGGGSFGGGRIGIESVYKDMGGASRFYYVAKPSREERDYGCDSLPIGVADAYGEHRGRRMDEPSRIDGKPLSRGRNIHPTVKPVELMRWLVKLVTPPGGKVLDPFLGSGTTGMACRYELREFVGIEKEADYIAIAEGRIAAVAPLFGEPA